MGAAPAASEAAVAETALAAVPEADAIKETNQLTTNQQTSNQTDNQTKKQPGNQTNNETNQSNRAIPKGSDAVPAAAEAVVAETPPAAVPKAVAIRETNQQTTKSVNRQPDKHTNKQ